MTILWWNPELIITSQNKPYTSKTLMKKSKPKISNIRCIFYSRPMDRSLKLYAKKIIKWEGKLLLYLNK